MTSLPFWSEQLPTNGDWLVCFRRWRCHPDDKQFSHLASALDEARQLAAPEHYTALPSQHQLAVVVCLSQSEDVADHRLVESLAKTLSATGSNTAALREMLARRQQVLQEFGRFPARNRAMGRASTPTEAYFMLGEGSLYP